MPAPLNTETDLLHEYWEEMRLRSITRALADIPVDERRAIELAYFDGHTYLEVAELLQQPEGTIKSRIRSGMRRMRHVLVDAGFQGAET